MAIGNPFNLGHTVTVGVVSYLGRPFQTSEGRFQKMIQTDASINPGNSGGPLIDTDGRVVGINAAILGGEEGGNIGIGFAVPIRSKRRHTCTKRRHDQWPGARRRRLHGRNLELIVFGSRR